MSLPLYLRGAKETWGRFQMRLNEMLACFASSIHGLINLSWAQGYQASILSESGKDTLLAIPPGNLNNKWVSLILLTEKNILYESDQLMDIKSSRYTSTT